MKISDAVGQKLLFAFVGKEVPSPEIVRALQTYRPGGVTLFRSLNVDHPTQVRVLTRKLQAAAQEAGLPPLIIAVDQEGGQLMAVGEGATQLPGNLALGATGSANLARQAGSVLGRELSAMGINVDYAPCCDVNINSQNPVVGTRSFGEDPQQVAELAAAMVTGIQSSGVAACAKHFPGHGDTFSDSHHGVPVIPHSLEHLSSVEFPPFEAAIHANVRLVMTGHLALPAVDGRSDLPATLSPAILKGLLRQKLGFDGVITTDAMDMGAIRQGEELGEEAIRAAQAGADLLLLTTKPEDQRRAHASLVQAIEEGRLDQVELLASAGRIRELKHWIAAQGSQPGLDILGSAAHRAVADEIAARSITLVRDQAALLPLRLDAGQRMAVIILRPLDLTPADTSSYVKPALAQALRSFHDGVDDYMLPHAPEDSDIDAVIHALRDCDLVVIGTINASTQPGQAALVRAVLQTGIPTVVIALRMPYDLLAFPEASTYLCCYSILEPSMRALARALVGQAGCPGRLPVSIPGMYVIGHPNRSGGG